MAIIFCTQGQVTPKWIVQVAQILNSSQIVILKYDDNTIKSESFIFRTTVSLL